MIIFQMCQYPVVIIFILSALFRYYSKTKKNAKLKQYNYGIQKL